jgi:hypothetical protein
LHLDASSLKVQERPIALSSPKDFADNNYLHQLSNVVSFTYDVEGRRTLITYPFGSPAVTTTSSYDIIGRLLGQTTVQGGTNLLNLSYGYDQASNRVGMVAGSDTFDYDLDASNRLINVSLNTFVEQLVAHFTQGTFSGTELDVSTPAMRLLANNDDFSSSQLNFDRWRLATVGSIPALDQSYDFVGLEVRQENGLLIAYPRGYTSVGIDGSIHPGWTEPFGLGLNSHPEISVVTGATELRSPVSGDLDIQVDFSNFQGYSTRPIGYGYSYFTIGLIIQDTPLHQSPSNQLLMGLQSSIRRTPSSGRPGRLQHLDHSIGDRHKRHAPSSAKRVDCDPQLF